MPTITAPRTNLSRLDTATRATLLYQLRQARRISTCPLCAEPRQRVTTEQGAYIVCPRCGDVETLREEGGETEGAQ
jgi:predicted RNA-binding Zn-ribbon protein involved in translation (DUF1610 family)